MVKRLTERNGTVEQQDTVLTFLAQVPIDDEHVLAEDERAIAEGWEAYQRGDIETAEEATGKMLAPSPDRRGVKDAYR